MVKGSRLKTNMTNMSNTSAIIYRYIIKNMFPYVSKSR